MLNRHNLEIAKLAPKERSRFSLNGLRVQSDRTIETDGHQLVMVTTPKAGCDDFPVIPGFSGRFEGFKPFTIPADAALAIGKAIPKRGPHPLLQNAAIGAETDVNGHAEIAVTDLESPQVFTPKKMDGQFPDWERVIPDKAKATFSIGFDAKMLADILAQAAKFTNSPRRAVVLHFTDDNSAVRIDSENSDTGQEFTAVVMPLRK